MPTQQAGGARAVHLIKALAVAGVVLPAGCATPTNAELRAMKPNGTFVVDAELACLYEHGVERARSYTGMTEPRFTWHLGPEQEYAWFRQRLTLIELDATETGTRVERSQTDAAVGLEQGRDLLDYLRSNPCRT